MIALESESMRILRCWSEGRRLGTANGKPGFTKTVRRRNMQYASTHTAPYGGRSQGGPYGRDPAQVRGCHHGLGVLMSATSKGS